ncbi:hypothetical protein [Paramagnetospirillum kuznetsovii]|uniref:hypothetical protein n=1 Tax=Paramagnetospirillum kuznetsovii TaxID=2053833 RepID=UPI0011BE3671|nr:hypothetical protein [Paramagnetospirillum kuznetsovii]
MPIRKSQSAHMAVKESGSPVIYDEFILEKRVRSGMFCSGSRGGDTHRAVLKTWIENTNPECAKMLARVRAKREPEFDRDNVEAQIVHFRRPGGPVRTFRPKLYGPGEFPPPPPKWLIWSND